MPPRQTQGLDSGSTNFLQFASLDVKDKSLASSLQLLSDHGMGANPCKILFDTLLDANYPKTVRNGYLLVFCWGCLLRICAEDHLVNFSPVSLVGLLLHIVADLLLLEVEGATVGVVDDGDFIDGKEAVQDADVPESMLNVAASIAMNNNLYVSS